MATAPIPPLAWEPPYAVGVALRRAKKKTKKQKTKKRKNKNRTDFLSPSRRHTPCIWNQRKIIFNFTWPAAGFVVDYHLRNTELRSSQGKLACFDGEE